MIPNTDILKGKWSQYKGKIKEKWGELTNDDLQQISGKRDIFLGKLQERYGYDRKKAEDELKRFEREIEEE